jgi:transposase, IS5 family
MYRKKHTEQTEFEDFHLSFGGRLRSDNRWVLLAKMIPWEEIEKRYERKFTSRTGPPALIARIALGSLIIKEKLGLTDEETVEQIRENPYLQYFLGYSSFSDEKPFDPSMMVHFRRRIGDEVVSRINELIIEKNRNGGNDGPDECSGTSGDEKAGDDGNPGNEGTLLMDATCVPSAIRYPTDLSLLNEVREKTEAIIDTLHAPDTGDKTKPRTYRRKARKQYLQVAKSRKPRMKAIRKALRRQLQYIRRNLETISREYPDKLNLLSGNQYRSLLVSQQIYRQQREMYEKRTRSIPGRIVSLSQPHVRPVVRGKTSAPVEFGAKIGVAKADGFVYLDHVSWDPYHESRDLPVHVESYRRRFGRYPATVHADAIYRTRDNRRYCRERGIRLGGPPLGRPKTNPTREEKRQITIDERSRIPIEGVIGRAKNRYSLGRILSKRADTSVTSIALVFLVMNLDTLLRQLFYTLIRWMIFGSRRRLFPALTS